MLGIRQSWVLGPILKFSFSYPFQIFFIKFQIQVFILVVVKKFLFLNINFIWWKLDLYYQVFPPKISNFLKFKLFSIFKGILNIPPKSSSFQILNPKASRLSHLLSPKKLLIFFFWVTSQLFPLLSLLVISLPLSPQFPFYHHNHEIHDLYRAPVSAIVAPSCCSS